MVEILVLLSGMEKKTTATKLYTHILYLNNVTFVQTEEDGCEQCNDTFDEHM